MPQMSIVRSCKRKTAFPNLTKLYNILEEIGVRTGHLFVAFEEVSKKILKKHHANKNLDYLKQILH